MAYRNRDFKAAVNYLQEVLDGEPLNWRAKLYLGMSFFYSGDILMAGGQFRALVNSCTDSDIQRKAAAAMQAINSHIKAMPEMTCTIKKPSLPPNTKPKDFDNEGCDVEWVQHDIREHT